ncbi:MAG: hypothetical protein HZA01_15250 [Nitrospinae bacterium]|nr:hypothetical protein [Nitrospinota bacterium]
MFVFVPGWAIYRRLPDLQGSLPEQCALASGLGYLLLHPLAYVMFLMRSDASLFLYLAGCLVYVGKEAFVWLRKKKMPVAVFSNIEYPKVIAWVFLITAVLYSHLVWGNFGLFRVGGDLGNNYGAVLPWDDLHTLSMINESRHRFLPEDNPFLPGEMPFYHSWLGNLMASFLIKVAGTDQLHAYFSWSPLFFFLIFFGLLYHLIRRLGGEHWPAFLGIGFFYLAPELGLYKAGMMPLRNLAGLFMILCTLIFMKSYLDHQRPVFLFLSFSWTLLYVVKGNYLVPALPVAAAFCFLVVWNASGWKARLRELGLCALGVLPLLLMAWVSRKFFALLFLPDTMFFFDWTRIIHLFQEILIIVPLIIVIAFERLKRVGAKPLSQIEKVLWTGVASFMVYGLVAQIHLLGDAAEIVLHGLVMALPVALFRVGVARPVLLGAGATALAVFFWIFLLQPRFENCNEYFSMTQDEFAVVRYLRAETPESSVFLHNVMRYNDRPSFLSALSYRKSFIDEAERFAGSYQRILEQRLYDYFNFYTSGFSPDFQRYFFSMHKNIDYYVEYDASFLKEMSPLGGQPRQVNATPLPLKDPSIFRPVFKSGTITVYHIQK